MSDFPDRRQRVVQLTPFMYMQCIRAMTILSRSPVSGENMTVSKTPPAMPAGAPNLAEILIQTRDMPWREKSLKGLHEKMLWRDEASGATISLNKFEKGAGIPKPHSHASNQFMFCLEGRYEYTATNTVLTPGCFYCNPKRMLTKNPLDA